MEQTIKVSSITYVKNCIKYIERCIRSVMDQTMHEIEIIVVDGGSTDGTLDVLERLRKEDERIIILHTAGSVGLQFNTALKTARGEYVSVCEGDDYILPDKYEYLYKIASEQKLDVIRANFFLTFSGRDEEFRYEMPVIGNHSFYERLLTKEENPDLFLRTGVNGFWSGLYLRSFLLDNGIYMNETPGAAYQDMTFSFLAQHYARRYWFSSKVLHCYRVDNEEASSVAANSREMALREQTLLEQRLSEHGILEERGKMLELWKKDINVSAEQVAAVTDKLIKYFKEQYNDGQVAAVAGIDACAHVLSDYIGLRGGKVIFSDTRSSMHYFGYNGEKVYSPEQTAAMAPDIVILTPTGCLDGTKDRMVLAGLKPDKIMPLGNCIHFIRHLFVKEFGGNSVVNRNMKGEKMSKEELNELKKKVAEVQRELSKLSDEELDQVFGGLNEITNTAMNSGNIIRENNYVPASETAVPVFFSAGTINSPFLG